jgi:hypothetical protein
MAPMILQGLYPDIGVEEIPTNIYRLNELTVFAIEKAKRHEAWENSMDPRHRKRNHRDMEAQVKRIMKWFDYFLDQIIEAGKHNKL